MSNNEKKEEEIVFKGRTEAKYKVIVIGDPAVGKSELIARFVTNRFEKINLKTIGGSFNKKQIELRDYNVTVNLFIFEIAGSAKDYIINSNYFYRAAGMLLVFDLTSSSTFSNIDYWYSVPEKTGLSGIPRILIGNNAHLTEERKIDLPMAKRLAKKLNAPYYETSALNGENVKDVFEKIAELVYRAQELNDNWNKEPLIVKRYKVNSPKKISRLRAKLRLYRYKQPTPHKTKTSIPSRPEYQDTNLCKRIKISQSIDNHMSNNERERKILFRIEKSQDEITDQNLNIGLQKKQTLLFKINPNGTTTKIESEGFIKDKLSSEECYVIVSDEYRKVYLWKGVNSNVRSKFIGAKRSQDIRGQVGMHFGVVPLDEGEEDSDFLNLRLQGLSDRDKYTIIQSLKHKETKKKSDYDNDDDDRFPYPYIFKPSNPPEDFVMAPQVQVHTPPEDKKHDDDIYCQYCGIKLTKEEQLTHSCKKTPKKK